MLRGESSACSLLAPAGCLSERVTQQLLLARGTAELVEGSGPGSGAVGRVATHPTPREPERRSAMAPALHSADTIISVIYVYFYFIEGYRKTPNFFFHRKNQNKFKCFTILFLRRSKLTKSGLLLSFLTNQQILNLSIF